MQMTCSREKQGHGMPQFPVHCLIIIVPECHACNRASHLCDFNLASLQDVAMVFVTFGVSHAL